MIIGNFKKADGNGFKGTIRTLTLNLEVAIEPIANKKTGKGPDYRITAGDTEIGAAWKKSSEAGNAYLSINFDDPALPATIFCALVKTTPEHAYSLVWERKRKTKTETGSGEF